jgi:hypothetical protein
MDNFYQCPSRWVKCECAILKCIKIEIWKSLKGRETCITSKITSYIETICTCFEDHWWSSFCRKRELPIHLDDQLIKKQPSKIASNNTMILLKKILWATRLSLSEEEIELWGEAAIFSPMVTLEKLMNYGNVTWILRENEILIEMEGRSSCLYSLLGKEK